MIKVKRAKCNTKVKRDSFGLNFEYCHVANCPDCIVKNQINIFCASTHLLHEYAMHVAAWHAVCHMNHLISNTYFVSLLELLTVEMNANQLSRKQKARATDTLHKDQVLIKTRTQKLRTPFDSSGIALKILWTFAGGVNVQWLILTNCCPLLTD
uniref:Uncharacterized protein n=1 Tax=Glossina pallidipes TaxID=7398 RepID=A0A1B0AC55_GLOPL